MQFDIPRKVSAIVIFVLFLLIVIGFSLHARDAGFKRDCQINLAHLQTLREKWVTERIMDILEGELNQQRTVAQIRKDIPVPKMDDLRLMAPLRPDYFSCPAGGVYSLENPHCVSCSFIKRDGASNIVMVHSLHSADW